MSKVVPPGSESEDIFAQVEKLEELHLACLQQARALKAELKKHPPPGKDKAPKLLFTTKEAAGILNVPDSLLATAARKGKVSHRIIGERYRYFSMADIEEIIDKAFGKVVLTAVNGKRDGPLTCRSMK